MSDERSNARGKSFLFKLAASAILLAMAMALSIVSAMIPGLQLPFGGSISIFSLLPIVLISWMFGLGWGFCAAHIFSLFRILRGMATVSALFLPESDSYMGVSFALIIIFLDYICAFTALGLGGVFRKAIKNKTASLVLGGLVALLVSYFFHVLSGAIFYGEWAEWFFTDTIVKDWAVSKFIMEHFSGTGLAIVYSIVYNGCYMVPEIILTSIGAAAVSAIPQVRLYDGKRSLGRP